MLDSWGIGRCRGSCRGRCWESGRRQLRYRESIEQQRINVKNRSSIDPPGVEELSRRQELSRSIHQAWETRQIERYRGGVEEVSSQFFKIVFREKKNTDMNAIQHTTQPMIQSTQKSLKIVSQSKNFEHKDLQNTHTHTLNKSNQFYISKISHDSLVSIH